MSQTPGHMGLPTAHNRLQELCITLGSRNPTIVRDLSREAAWRFC